MNRSRRKPRTSGKDNIMNKELYDELREIECRLYDILESDGGVLEHKLAPAWAMISCYLTDVEK